MSERTLQRLERGDTGASIGTVSAVLQALEQRGIVLCGGDSQSRGGVKVLKGTDADRQLEEEMARGASAAKDSDVSSGERTTGDPKRTDPTDDLTGATKCRKH